MQILTEGQMQEMAKRGGLVPPRHPIRYAWLAVVDAFVRVVTLGYGRVMPINRSDGPVHWDGIIR